MTEPSGTVISHLYDNLDRLEQKQWVSAGNQDDLTVTYQYDANHNRIQTAEQWPANSSNQNKIHSYQYDNFDRLLLTTDSHGKTFTTFYYLNGQRKQFIDHDKNAIFYQIDRLNRVTTVDDRSINATTIYDYYPDSRLKSVSYANHTQSHYDYDQRGRIKRIENRQNDQLLSQFDYAYDDNDNRTKQTVVNGGEEEITTYDYDNQDRLTTVYYPEYTASYTYDDASNRLTEQSTDNDTGEIKANYQYQYNNRNQLTTRTDQLDATHNIQYHYDANGNQTQKIKNGITTEFTYDVRNHLRSIHEDGTALGQYQYNEQGLRTHKTGERGKINISYDDQSIIRQYDENGITQAKYSYGPNRLLSLDHATEGTQFYLTDALNSTVNLTNANGLVQARYHYDAWGNPQANKNTGDSWNRFGFTGHEHDKETNLIYAKARFYDPDIGRFLSQDAWEGDLNTPPSLNKYLYAYQNPTVYIDPDGNSAERVYQETAKQTITNVVPKMVTTAPSVAANASTYTAAATSKGFLSFLGPVGAFISGMLPTKMATDAEMAEYASRVQEMREREQYKQNNPSVLDARGGNEGFADSKVLKPDHIRINIESQKGPNTNPSRLLEHIPDPTAYDNEDIASKILPRDSFLKYYVKKDEKGNPLQDKRGKFIIDPYAQLPKGQYITFKKDIDGMDINNARNATTIESFPTVDPKAYTQYDGENIRLDFDVSDIKNTKLEFPPKADYLNDIGGPRALDGARQRVNTEALNIGDRVIDYEEY